MSFVHKSHLFTKKQILHLKKNKYIYINKIWGSLKFLSWHRLASAWMIWRLHEETRSPDEWLLLQMLVFLYTFLYLLFYYFYLTFQFWLLNHLYLVLKFETLYKSTSSSLESYFNLPWIISNLCFWLFYFGINVVIYF